MSAADETYGGCKWTPKGWSAVTLVLALGICGFIYELQWQYVSKGQQYYRLNGGLKEMHPWTDNHQNSSFAISMTPDHTLNLSCRLIIQKDSRTLQKAKLRMKQVRQIVKTPMDYITMTKNCSNFIHQRSYIVHEPTTEDAEFPIAFGILIFKDFEQLERLLRLIYRPQNYYCIHVDAKCPKVMHDAMSSVARCFPNVVKSSKSLNLVWGRTLNAELQCMEDLWKYKRWKYYINLTGQEMPLKTNRGLVQILKAMKGGNDLEGSRDRHWTRRWEKKLRRSPPPSGVQLAKGGVHLTASRGYVDYVLHSRKAKEFLNWVMDGTDLPDETFFNSLNFSPQLRVPGAYKGEPDHKPWFTRYKEWDKETAEACQGQIVRWLCIFGIGDLPRLHRILGKTHYIFINKFYLEYEYLSLDCMEEMLINRTIWSYSPQFSFNVSWYSNLPHAQQHFD